MICKLCEERIETQSEQFEEIGSIEFAHTECVEKLDDVDDYKKEPQSANVSQGAA